MRRVGSRRSCSSTMQIVWSVKVPRSQDRSAGSLLRELDPERHDHSLGALDLDARTAYFDLTAAADVVVRADDVRARLDGVEAITPVFVRDRLQCLGARTAD